MKKFMSKYFQITVLTSLLLLIFVLGGVFSRYMTSQIEVHANDNAIKEFNQSLINLVGSGELIEEFDVVGIDKEYDIPGLEGEKYQPELIGAYKVYDSESKVIAVVYIISTIGRDEGLEIAYAIDIESKVIIDTMVVDSSETPDYFQALNFGFYNQLKNKTLDEVLFNLDAVTGATLSCLAVETGMQYARELFARDFDFTIPDIVYTINSVIRNFDKTTMADKPFIVNITYGSDNQELEAYFDNDLNYLETISGTEPNQLYKDVFKDALPTQASIDLRAKVIDYDSTTRTLSVLTRAYHRDNIIIEVTFDETFTSITSLTIISKETYDSDYNDLYTGAPSPVIENAYKDQYLADGSYLDTFAGATVTSNGIIRLLTLIDEVMSAWNGGN